MTNVTYITLNGASAGLEPAAISQFASHLKGKLITAADSDFDTARAVHNGMIDRRPALIAQCDGVDDVAACVNFARERSIRLSVRGGGHSAPGLGVCDGGLVIDLASFKSISVDPAGRTVWVGGGCTWGEVDQATHPHGLAVPCGIIASTGVGGLTLGGGHGYLTRKYGLTIDNLLAAKMVLADGSQVTASQEENPDLFWAIRGGGGNFGVVTSFQFRCHPVSTVVAGPTFWEMEKAGDVMRWYRDFIRTAPEELAGFFAFLVVPPGPPFPEALHLKQVCGVVWCYSGPVAQADAVFKPVAEFMQPLLHGVGAMPLPAFQSAFDPLYPKGLQWYWKGDFFRELTDEAITAHLRHGTKLPTMLSSMHLYPIDGAPNRVGSSETAFSHRDAAFSEVIIGVDPDPANTELVTNWARSYWEDLHPHSSGGAYVNFMMDEGQERVKATYRGNYERLTQVKAKYDPGNLFRVNQNIAPK